MKLAAFPAARRGRNRLRIYERDGHRCARCGLDIAALTVALRSVPDRAAMLRGLGLDPLRGLWEVNHKLPLFAGGSDEDCNKELLCSRCHRKVTAEQAGQRARAPRRKLAAVPKRASPRWPSRPFGRSAPPTARRPPAGCAGTGRRPRRVPAPPAYPRFRGNDDAWWSCRVCQREFHSSALRAGKLPPHPGAET